jgi:hypothetical protein
LATLISVSRVPTQRRVKRQSNERVQHTDFLKSRRSPYRCLLKSPAGGRPVARQSVPAGLPGEHTLKETLVPIPNTTVKLLGPMIVPTSAKVGHRRVHFNTPSGSPRRGVLLRPLPTATLAGTLGLPLGAGRSLLGVAVVRPPSAVRMCCGRSVDRASPGLSAAVQVAHPCPHAPDPIRPSVWISPICGIFDLGNGPPMVVMKLRLFGMADVSHVSSSPCVCRASSRAAERRTGKSVVSPSDLAVRSQNPVVFAIPRFLETFPAVATSNVTEQPKTRVLPGPFWLTLLEKLC